MEKEIASNKIAELIAKYQNLSQIEISGYNEARTKQALIEPLFRALGWNFEDINEVTPEEKTSNGRVDYAFKLNGISEFYLEAKPLRDDISTLKYIKQVITYAYNKGVTWAVLTNFVNLRIYNAQTGNIFINLSCEKYLKELDDLWAISKESILSNGLNEKAERYGALLPRLGIEDRLFAQLLKWRGELFSQLHLHNKRLSFGDIDEIILRLFNRMIFIRTCEDRRIEEKTLLSVIHEGKEIDRNYLPGLRKLFSYYDGYYDSNLFEHHLIDEQDVFIESPTIEYIINGLYEVPGGMASYDFSIIDADVFGTVYEQYLGHIASIVKQRAKEAQSRMDLGIPVKETFELVSKKQRRKEQGIYYTPKYVTNYIMKETVGRFIEENEATKIQNIKILDPACGSGSFLIRAYDELLNFHESKSSKTVSDIDQEKRMAILTSNIFGVDLDPQATQIAQLNLLLRSLAKRKLLPSLSMVIRNGNSYISGDEKELKPYFGKKWAEKKPFNWVQEHKEILRDGGFDVIIGNPPWVSLKGKHKSLDFAEEELDYLFDHYDINTYSPNLFEVFILRSLSLLKEGGLFSFIVPDRLAANQQYCGLRKHILENYKIEKIQFRIPFPSVIADTMIFVIRKEKPQADYYIEVSDYKTNKKNKVSNMIFLLSSDYAFFFIEEDIERVFMKINKSKGLKPLDYFVKSTSGCGAKSSLLSEKKLSKEDKRIIKGENIGRYESKGYYWFPFKDENLTGRTRDIGKLSLKEKVLLRKTGIDIIATYDDSGIYPEQSLYFLYDADKETLLYLLAVINSKLINVYYRNFAITNRDATPQLKNIDLDKFPIIETSKNARANLANLAKKAIMIKAKISSVREYSDECRTLEREYNKTLSLIDKEVYKVYELTPEEIEIIENYK